MFGTIYEPLTFKPACKINYVWNIEERTKAERAKQVDAENHRILVEEVIPAINARGYRHEFEEKMIELVTNAFTTTYANYYKGVN